VINTGIYDSARTTFVMIFVFISLSDRVDSLQIYLLRS
jgi:hypothetical protein